MTINKNCEPYHRLKRILEAKTVGGWLIDGNNGCTVHYKEADALSKKTFKKDVFTKSDLDLITPCIFKILQNYQKQGGSIVLMPTWKYWHNPGIFWDKNESACFHISTITIAKKKYQLIAIGKRLPWYCRAYSSSPTIRFSCNRNRKICFSYEK